MKYLICFLLSISICSKVNAQEFSQEFTNNTTLSADAYAISRAPNKNWAILTEVDDVNNFRNTISALSISNSGSIQFVNSYATTDTSSSISCKQVLSLPNGDVIIAGTYSSNSSFPYYPFFMSLDTNGNVNWVKQMDIASASGNIYLKQLSDNSILVNLKYNDGASHQLLFKLDPLGNFTGFYEYNLTSASVKDVLVDTNSFDLLLSDGNFINIDNDLQTINWHRKYNQEIGITINKAANGDYLLATAQVAFPAHMTVSRLDSSGVIIWSKYIETFENITLLEFDIVGFHFISEDSNGDIIVCADSEGGGNGSLFMKLDGNGNYISNHKSTSFRNKMTQPTNNSFMYGGFKNFGTYNTSNFVFNKLILYSSLDCDVIYNHTFAIGSQSILTPDTFILTPISGINTLNISIVKNPKIVNQQNYCNSVLSISTNFVENPSISIYPNPVNTAITINSISPIEKVSVYDSCGKLLFDKYVSNKLNVSHLDRGIYFLNIQTERGQVLKKIIKD